MAKITVIGAGSWGTAQAHHLRRAGHEVLLWGCEFDSEVLRQVSQERRHKFFPGVTIAAGIETSQDLEYALKDRDLVAMAVPSQVMRSVAKEMSSCIGRHTVVVNTSKGLEKGTLCRMSEVLYQELGYLERLTVLSGPSFAGELIRNLPTAVTVAGYTRQATETVKQAYHFDNMRIYTSSDIVGVELGGVLKNIFALATGINDGCKMGNNGRAALLTRGLAEMSRLVVALGGNEATVQGLSGMGDMVLTATGDLSRNRTVGLRLGAGETLEQIMQSMEQVAEGVYSTQCGVELAKANGVEVPIMSVTAEVLAGRLSAAQAMEKLLARAPKKER